ncbi:MAG: hypothetical protein IPK31_06145 [Chitinophagaceae bacterium]|nr:hypothetical protein [Chitinophagaceae bacterium]
MKKIFFICLLTAFYYSLPAQTVRQLRKSVTLKMPKGPGENGGTVAINLKNRFYYATIAGNKTYSIAYFNAVGEMVSPPDLALLADVRGMWYSPGLKTMQANAFGSIGWVNYVLDDAGIPYDVKPFLSGQLQPFPNSVAQYNQRENLVHFLKGSTVVAYDAATGKEVKEKTVLLKTGYSKKAPPPAGLLIDSARVLPQYNSTTVLYTGISNAEFGLLNLQTNEIELYSKADGLLTQKLKLPADARPNDKLNFSFCNNVYFIYDVSTRSWFGYR